jgi:hypothetical protein
VQPTYGQEGAQEIQANNWIAVKRTGRSNQYQILKHGWVMPQGKEAIVTLQIDQTDPSDRSQRPIRKITVTNDSYQGLSSETTHQEPPPKPPKGVVVVFDFEEGEVTKEKALKDAPPLMAKQSRSRSSFVTPPSGENPSGFDLRSTSATRGGGLESRRSAGEPDAAPYTLEGVSTLARELGLSRSEGRDIYQGWVNGEFHNPLAIVRHRAKNEAAREAARKTRWEQYGNR